MKLIFFKRPKALFSFDKILPKATHLKFIKPQWIFEIHEFPHLVEIVNDTIHAFPLFSFPLKPEKKTHEMLVVKIKLGVKCSMVDRISPIAQLLAI